MSQTLRSQLEELECHFTWFQQSDYSRSKLLRLRDNLEDIGTDIGYQWPGQIYNLQAYIHYQLSSQDDTLGSTTNDALCCLSKATEAFRQIRNAVSDEGPWLLVNYSNMAWLYFHLGEQEKGQEYVSKVVALLQKYPSTDELHAEVYAEKAWTLMHFSLEGRHKVIEYFQKALSMDPDRAEWLTSQALTIVRATKDSCTSNQEQEAELLKKLKTAKENDPENVYVAVIYLQTLANTGQRIEDEARELAQIVLQKPVSSYSGINQLLKLYRMHVSFDEAIDLAKEALEKHPDGPNNNRYLKKCLASCYKWKIYSDRNNCLNQSLVDQAIILLEEVISLYPHSSLRSKLALASVYAQSIPYKAKADLLFSKLLESNLDEPKQLQLLYNRYAQHLYFHLKNTYMSSEYHMMAAKIPLPSRYRANSIRILRQITSRGRARGKRYTEIQHFLDTLQEEPDTVATGTKGTTTLPPSTGTTPQSLGNVENEPCLRPAWSKT